MTTTIDPASERRGALVGRLFEATLAAMDRFNLYLGDRLGLYRTLAEAGPSTRAMSSCSRAAKCSCTRRWAKR